MATDRTRNRGAASEPAGPPNAPSWYDEVDAYELAFGFDTAREVAMLSELLDRAGVTPPARLLEPMVGSGRLLPGLSAAGFDVFGFDLARPMLRRAHGRAPGRVFRADAAAFATGRAFDAAYCLIDSFRYLRTTRDAARFLDALARAVIADGPLVLELDLVAPGPPVPETWTTTIDGYTARASILSHGDAGPDLQWMDVTVEISGPDGERTVKSRLPQRTWTPFDLHEFLADHPGFDLTHVWRRSQEAGSPLPGIPDNGGPVTLLLRATGASQQ